MDDLLIDRERAVCELYAIIVCFAEEVEVEEIGFEDVVEFFFFVTLAQILVHLGELELGAGGGEIAGEGEKFGGHFYLYYSIKPFRESYRVKLYSPFFRIGCLKTLSDFDIPLIFC